MDKRLLPDAVDKGKRARYKGAEYICVGYQKLKRDGGVTFSAGLLDTRTRRCLVWAKVDKVELEEQ